MNLVLYTHPAFLGSHSHQHFARMLLRAYQRRGHTVELRQPEAVLRARIEGRLAKWAGYVDQYLIYPRKMRRQIESDPPGTLYVFCDQALGPLIPNAAHRPHVVHCHDLLALRSALGLVPQNPTGRTGRIYQRYIRAGFQKARHFISVSEKSRADLHEFGEVRPITSEVVYNGLNHPYRRQDAETAAANLHRAGLPAPDGFLLHIGGGQWYKNTEGVVALYGAYASRRMASGQPVLPLWMISPAPSASVQTLLDDLPPGAKVRFFHGLDTDAIEALYSLASVLLFPSHAEGFGWPIAEALACGCPVITTEEAPMTEVGGLHAQYLPRLPSDGEAVDRWAAAGAQRICSLLDRSADERGQALREGITWTGRFDADLAIESYLGIYETVLRASLSGDAGAGS
jgi:glycosyltransferase involved in cell wall biosynthesis